MRVGKRMREAIRSKIWVLLIDLAFLALGLQANYPVVIALSIGALVIWPMRVLERYGELEDDV